MSKDLQYDRLKLNKLKLNKSNQNKKIFDYILISQGISGFGDVFQFIAMTLLLFKLTGSGLSAGAVLIAYPLASVIFSPLVGGIGNKFNEKNMLVVIDLIRAIIAFLFVFIQNIWGIYILMFLLYALDIIYSPPKNKIIKKVVKDKELVTAQSIQTGIGGAVSIIGPITASIMVNWYGADIAFIINSISFIMSAGLIMLIPGCIDGHSDSNCDLKEYFLKRNEIGDGSQKHFIRYNRRNARLLKEMIAMGFVFSTVSISTNTTFYSMIFDSIKVSDSEWGMIISVFSGTSIIAMFMSLFIAKRLSDFSVNFIKIPIGISALVWITYSICTSVNHIYILQFVEGTSSALFGILYSAKMLKLICKDDIVKVCAFNDFIINSGKILGYTLTHVAMGHVNNSMIFVFNAIVLFAYELFLKFRK